MTPVNLPRGGVNGSLDIQCLPNGGSRVIERRLSNFCLQFKSAVAHGKHDNNDTLNDSWKFLMQVYEKLTRPVPNYTHIYFPYSTVTSACQGSGLACTRTVSIFRMLTYMQTRFCHEDKSFYVGIGMK